MCILFKLKLKGCALGILCFVIKHKGDQMSTDNPYKIKYIKYFGNKIFY